MSKFYLYYNKESTLMISIEISNKMHSNYNYISITEEDKNKILNGLNNNKVCLVKNYRYSLVENTNKKRNDIVEERDKLLREIDVYFTERYQRVLELTEEDKEDLFLYYVDLLNLPQDFDSCESKDCFQYVFVEEKSSEVYSNTVELVKPNFVGK